MSQLMQCLSDNDKSEQMINEIKSLNNGHPTYWQALPALARRLHGELVLPGDADFDSLRTAWNTAFDGYPTIIIRCLVTGDVTTAVTFARELGMVVSVCNAGHSIAGPSTNYNGMVIDLSAMKAIEPSDDDSKK